MLKFKKPCWKTTTRSWKDIGRESMEAKYAFWECISDGVEKYNQAEKKNCSGRQLPRTKGNLFMETNKWWEENINLRDKDRKIRNRKSMLNRQNVPSEEYTGLPKDWGYTKKTSWKWKFDFGS